MPRWCRPVGPRAQFVEWTGRESNPPHRPCKGQSPPGNMPAQRSRGPSGNRTRSSSVPRRCAAETPTDRSFQGDPGWSRTIAFLVVTQASSPLDHGIMQVTGTGVEPAKSRGSRRRRFSCLRTRSWRVRGSHPAVPAYEAGLDSGPPAVAGPGIEPGKPAV